MIFFVSCSQTVLMKLRTIILLCVYIQCDHWCIISQLLNDCLQKYYHGESIAVNVLVDNNTNKTVKKIKISGKFSSDLFISFVKFVFK